MRPLLPPADPFMWLWLRWPRPNMRTRLPTLLAILGGSLLLSFIEAEGKRLFLPLPQWQCWIIEKKKEVNFPSALLCSPTLYLFSRGFSPSEKLPLLLRFVHFPALRSSSFVFCLIRSVQCCVVGLLALVSAVCCPHCHLPCCLPRRPVVREGATAAPTSTKKIPPGATQEPWCAGGLAPLAGNYLARGCDLCEGTK